MFLADGSNGDGILHSTSSLSGHYAHQSLLFPKVQEARVGPYQGKEECRHHQLAHLSAM